MDTLGTAVCVDFGSTFTKAGLVGKSGPWSQYPGRMYQMRARAWAA